MSDTTDPVSTLSVVWSSCSHCIRRPTLMHARGRTATYAEPSPELSVIVFMSWCQSLNKVLNDRYVTNSDQKLLCVTASISPPNDPSKKRPAADRLTAALGNTGVETRISINAALAPIPMLPPHPRHVHGPPTMVSSRDGQQPAVSLKGHWWSLPLLTTSCTRDSCRHCRHWWFLVLGPPTVAAAASVA